MRRFVLQYLLCLALFGVPSTLAELRGDITNDPSNILKKYTELDYKGVRLEPVSNEVLRPFISWDEEPAWGTVVVIEGYEVLDHTKSWTIVDIYEVMIPVEYKILGTMYWETATFRSERTEERVLFRVKARAHRWRLTGPQIPPHVGAKRMINFVRHQMLEEKNPSRRAKLSALQEELRKARQR